MISLHVVLFKVKTKIHKVQGALGVLNENGKLTTCKI